MRSFRDTDCVETAAVKPSPNAQNPAVKQAELSNGSKNHNRSMFLNTETYAEPDVTNNLLSTEFLPVSNPAVLETNADLHDVHENLNPESVEVHNAENEQLSVKSVSGNSEGNCKDICMLLTVIPSKTTAGKLGLLRGLDKKKSHDEDEVIQPLIFRNGLDISTDVTSLQDSSIVKKRADYTSG
jgi:hypothetical protein